MKRFTLLIQDGYGMLHHSMHESHADVHAYLAKHLEATNGALFSYSVFRSYTEEEREYLQQRKEEKIHEQQ